MTHKISKDGTTAVDPDYYWRSLDTCPRGVSVWMYTIYGKAIEGQYRGDKDILGWAPKPKVPDWMKELR